MVQTQCDLSTVKWSKRRPYLEKVAGGGQLDKGAKTW